MGPKRSTSRVRPYDSANPANWTVKKLKDELSKRGITVSHAGVTRAALVQMYKDNCLRSVSRPSSLQSNINVNNELGDQQAQHPSSVDVYVTDSVSSDISDPVTTQNQSRPIISLPPGSELHFDSEAEPSVSLGDARSNLARTSSPSDRITSTCATARRDPPHTNMAAPIAYVPEQDTASILNRTLSLMEMTFKAFQANQPAVSSDPAFDMRTAYTNLTNIRRGVGDSRTTGATLDTLRQHADSDGIPADLLPQIDIVSPAIRKKIVQGKDINLALLLVPGYEHTSPDRDPLPSGRRGKLADLTISEFITAFGIYKRVVTEAFPSRRNELDRYEAIVIRLNNTHGPAAFNEYHRMFSARAAQYIEQENFKVKWGIRDKDIYDSVVAGRRPISCNICRSVEHSTHRCEQAKHPNGSDQSKTDRRNRPNVWHNGQVICNNFNTKGCNWSTCQRSHICSKCFSDQHGEKSCDKSKDKRSNPEVSGNNK